MRFLGYRFLPYFFGKAGPPRQGMGYEAGEEIGFDF